MYFNCASFSLLCFVVLFKLAAGVCYYPDGSVAPQDTACYNDAYNSTCCGQGYACLSNSICMATGDEIKKPGASLYVRGSCTDSTWRSNNCPQFCINPDYDDLGGGEGIAKCPNTTLDEYYCIDNSDNTTDCTSETNVLIFQGTPSVITTIGVTAAPTSTSTSTSTSKSSSTSSLTSASSSHTISGILATTKTTLAQSSSTSTLNQSQSSSQSSSHTVAIAAGIAVPAGVIIVSLLTFVLLHQRKRRRQTNLIPAPQEYRDSHNLDQYQYRSSTIQEHKPELPGSGAPPRYMNRDTRFELPAEP